MTRKTHLAIGTIVMIYFLKLTGAVGVVGLLGATAADWDVIYPGGHRKFTHGLPGWFIFSLLVSILDFRIGLIFTLTYLSHLGLDSLTKRGIPLFYPFSKKYYGLKLIKTGSVEEYLILIFIISAFILSY